MEKLVQKILENKNLEAKSMSPRSLFFKEFDLALQAISQGLIVSFSKLEEYGQLAGISSADILSRKKTLTWASTQFAQAA